MAPKALGLPPDWPPVPKLAWLCRAHPLGDRLLTLVVKACPLDGLVIRAHLRCKRCSILCGPKHLAKMLDTHGLCPSCHREVKRRQAKQAGKAKEVAT